MNSLKIKMGSLLGLFCSISNVKLKTGTENHQILNHHQIYSCTSAKHQYRPM